jgi:tetratricopeptide (TPR) repeat protein
MTQEVINYGWYMKTGEKNLNIGRYADAVIAFTFAASDARNSSESACAYQMQGVALRLNTDYPEAHIAFGIAMMYAIGDHPLRFRIERDEALVYMEEGNLQTAWDLLWDSYKGLRKLHDYIEAAASLGFLGRVAFVKGDRRRAYLLLAEADAMLRSVGVSGTYELNNLVWLFKRVSPLERIALLPRTLRLIKQTGQQRRLIEVVLLTVGGNRLYNYAKRRLHEAGI